MIRSNRLFRGICIGTLGMSCWADLYPDLELGIGVCFGLGSEIGFEDGARCGSDA